jgi:hypothetical protein
VGLESFERMRPADIGGPRGAYFISLRWLEPITPQATPRGHLTLAERQRSRTPVFCYLRCYLFAGCFGRILP